MERLEATLLFKMRIAVPSTHRITLKEMVLQEIQGSHVDVSTMPGTSLVYIHFPADQETKEKLISAITTYAESNNLTFDGITV